MSFKKKLSHFAGTKLISGWNSGKDVTQEYFQKGKKTPSCSLCWSLVWAYLLGLLVSLFWQCFGINLNITLFQILWLSHFLFSRHKASQPEKFNILLTGVGGSGHDGVDLTDTIILASINRRTQTVSMLSLPRDLFVEIPTSRGTVRGKINEVYQRSLKNSTWSRYEVTWGKAENSGWNLVDKYLNIDFAGFKNL